MDGPPVVGMLCFGYPVISIRLVSFGGSGNSGILYLQEKDP